MYFQSNLTKMFYNLDEQTIEELAVSVKEYNEVVLYYNKALDVCEECDFIPSKYSLAF